MKINILTAFCSICNHQTHRFDELEAFQINCSRCGAGPLSVFLVRTMNFFASEEEEFAEAQCESMDCCKEPPAATLSDTESFLERIEGKSEDVCCICMEREGGMVKIKRCGHLFHKNCIEKWLRECKATCPICKINLL